MNTTKTIVCTLILISACFACDNSGDKNALDVAVENRCSGELTVYVDLFDLSTIEDQLSDGIPKKVEPGKISSATELVASNIDGTPRTEHDIYTAALNSSGTWDYSSHTTEELTFLSQAERDSKDFEAILVLDGNYCTQPT